MADNTPTTVNEGIVEAPTRKITGKVTNPRDIEWPLDQYGFTSMLKKEGVRAVGRIKGDPAKLQVFAGVLRCLAAHAQTKVKDQQVGIEQRIQADENRRLADVARYKADQEREVARLEAVAASARANFEAQKGNLPGEDADGE